MCSGGAEAEWLVPTGNSTGNLHIHCTVNVSPVVTDLGSERPDSDTGTGTGVTALSFTLFNCTACPLDGLAQIQLTGYAVQLSCVCLLTCTLLQSSIMY